MYYYKGSMRTLLVNSYNFLESIGFDVEWIDEHSHHSDEKNIFVCREFKSDGDNGTSEWIYSLGNDYCSDLEVFKDTIRTKRINNGNKKEINNKVYKWGGESIFWSGRVKLEENEWLEGLLCGMIPSRSYDKILNKFSIVEDKEIKKTGDLTEYKRVARDIRLSMILND